MEEALALDRVAHDLVAALHPATRVANPRLLRLATRLGAMACPPQGFEPVTAVEWVIAYRAILRPPAGISVADPAPFAISPAQARAIYNERLRHP